MFLILEEVIFAAVFAVSAVGAAEFIMRLLEAIDRL